MLRFPGLESVGWALLNSFWQMGLLALIYLVLTGRDSRYSAATRHNLALLLSIAGTCWFISGLFFPVSSPGTVSPSAGSLFQAGDLNPIAQYRITVLDRLVAFLPWIYGSVLLLRAGNAIAGVAIRRRFNQPVSAPAPGTEWTAFIDRCRRELGVRRTVLLRWVRDQGMARTYGFLKPVVLFPAAMLSRLSVSQVEAVLIHELAHIRRNDYIVHLWMSLFRFVFYFNPFASFLYETVSAEREKACDDLVMARAYPACDYAQALLLLEKFRQASPGISLAAAGHRPFQLAERIRRIAGLPVTPGKPRIARLLYVVPLAAIACYGLVPVVREIKKPETALLAVIPDSVRRPEPATAEAILPASPSASMHEAVKAIPPPPPPGAFPRSSVGERPGQSDPATPEIVADSDMTILPGLSPDQPDPASPRLENLLEETADTTTYIRDEQETAGAATFTPDYAGKKIALSFSYRSPVSAIAPKYRTQTDKPYIPSSSFAVPVADSVPVIALQSLQQNKPAVVHLLAKWKALQLQQTLSRSLELRYQQLKEKAQKDINTLPAKKEELRRSLRNLEQQMKSRKAEIDRLSQILAEEPVIYI